MARWLPIGAVLHLRCTVACELLLYLVLEVLVVNQAELVLFAQLEEG